MFRKACEITAKYTFPVVLFQRAVSGQCSCSIGAFVVVNDSGWIVTAHHIVRSIFDSDTASVRVKEIQAERAAIQADATLSQKARQKKLAAARRIAPADIQAYAVWFGLPGTGDLTVPQWHSVESADVAIGKLDRFDPSWISEYPFFKDHTKNFHPGTSLCKYGFPFHNIDPAWDAVLSQFQLPPGALPMPLFPIEGIFTREILLQPAPGTASGLTKMLETSSPGLRGQSGGPTFDEAGAIWAIQSSTSHLELGFAPRVRGGGIEHQFLNVGIGSHVATITALFNSFGVQYKTSAH